jgi:hypothetical protein
MPTPDDDELRDPWLLMGLTVALFVVIRGWLGY